MDIPCGRWFALLLLVGFGTDAATKAAVSVTDVSVSKALTDPIYRSTYDVLLNGTNLEGASKPVKKAARFHEARRYLIGDVRTGGAAGMRAFIDLSLPLKATLDTFVSAIIVKSTPEGAFDGVDAYSGDDLLLRSTVEFNERVNDGATSCGDGLQLDFDDAKGMVFDVDTPVNSITFHLGPKAAEAVSSQRCSSQVAAVSGVVRLAPPALFSSRVQYFRVTDVIKLSDGRSFDLSTNSYAWSDVRSHRLHRCRPEHHVGV